MIERRRLVAWLDGLDVKVGVDWTSATSRVRVHDPDVHAWWEALTEPERLATLRVALSLARRPPDPLTAYAWAEVVRGYRRPTPQAWFGAIIAVGGVLVWFLDPFAGRVAAGSLGMPIIGAGLGVVGGWLRLGSRVQQRLADLRRVGSPPSP